MLARESHIPSRTVTVLIVTAAHGLALWVCWSVRAPVITATESITAVLFSVPDDFRNATHRARYRTANPPQPTSTAANSASSNPAMRTTTSPRALLVDRDAGNSEALRPNKRRNTASASIDWAKEAETAAVDSLRRAAEASRQAMALTYWKSHVMPTPEAPAAPRFAWDYAQTHRFESSAQGLIINLNDRCSLLISLSLMAVMGGCKLGKLAVHGDLFTHMTDVQAPDDPAVKSVQ